MCNIYTVIGFLGIFLFHIVSSQRCPDGWMDGPRGNSCYLITTPNIKYTWTEGRVRCQQHQANLVKLDDVQERDWLLMTLGNLTATFPDLHDWWIGAYNKGDGNGWLWAADDSAVDISLLKWTTTSVPANDGSKHCASVYSQGFNSTNCNFWERIMCERPKSLPLVCNGDDEWQYRDGSCYKYIHSMITWDEASAYCERYSSHLSYVTSDDTQRFLWDMARMKGVQQWIGLRSAPAANNMLTWTWDRGPSLGSGPTYWARHYLGTITKENRNSTCVELGDGLQMSSSWVAVSCSALKSFVCQKPDAYFTMSSATPTPSTSAPACASGWDAYGTLCYKAFRMDNAKRKTWLEAEVYCQGLGGDLMSIHSKAQDNFVASPLLRYFYNANFWIGLSDRTKEGSYSWSDGSPFDYSSWYPNEPDNRGGNDDCVEYDQATRQWNDDSCFAAKDFICQIPRGLTVPTTIRTTTPPACAGSEKGWLYFNGYCYFISPSYGIDAKKNWYEARRYCMGEGGDLVSIHNDNDNSFLTTLVTKRTQSNYWIGLNQLGRDAYVWSDSTATDYIKWMPGEPNGGYGGQLCVSLYGGSLAGHGMWNDDNCMDINNYICKRTNGSFSTVTPTPTAPLTGGCPPSYVPFDNKCFVVGGLTPTGRMNWTDARNQCRAQGKRIDIASINSYSDQAFLIAYLKQQGVASTLWIGLNDRYQNGHYEWQDNTEVTYTNWNKGEPSDRYSFNTHDRQDCVSMTFGTRDRVGRWNDDKCTDRKGYICQTLKSNSYVTPTPMESSCKPLYQPFETSCYRAVTSPTTWQGGQMACQADGGNLVSITDLYEQSFVDTIAHNTNIMNGFWIGLSDKKVSGVYSWYDGWPVSYTRWGEEEPTRNVGEGCVAQQGQNWNDTLCVQNFPFICKISSTTTPPTIPTHPGFCPDKTWVPHGKYCYFAFPTEQKSWSEANYFCLKMGMQLVSVHSRTELDFIKTLLDQQTTTPRFSFNSIKPNVWLGLTKSKSGGFAWSDGSPANYFIWNKGEPSDVNDTQHENCVEYNRTANAWNDVDCFLDRAFICKEKKSNINATTSSPSATSATLPASAMYGCPHGWFSYNTSCYLLGMDKVTWSVAQTTCRAAGSDLVSIGSSQESSFITSQMQRGLNDGSWIGLSALNSSYTFIWTDGAPRSYTKWASSEPNYQGLKPHCVAMYAPDGVWKDEVCDTSHGYVCKSPLKILYSATTQPSPFSVGCPKGGLGYQQYCYQFNNTPLNWQSAETTCEHQGGHLATVNSYHTQSFLSAELTTRDDVYWIGLSDTATPGTYKWTTGDNLLFASWDKSHNSTQRSTCVAMRTAQPVGLWQNYQCNVIKPFICQLPRVGFTQVTAAQTPTTLAQISCASGWHVFGALCFKAFREGYSQRKTWSDALAYCQYLGGDLMSIHSKAQENFIEKTLLIYNFKDNFWIGLNDRTKEGSYYWSDSSPFDYSNWYRTEPDNLEYAEDCVAYDQATQQWNDSNCFEAKDFICQISQGATVPTTTVMMTTPTAACAGSDKGWIYFNGNCYFVSPSYGHEAKKTWSEARRYCMGEGGDLVSIHTIHDNNFLTTLVTKRRPSIYWIGFNNPGDFGFRWSDGTRTDFLSWNRGQPNDVGKHCVNLYGGVLAFVGFWSNGNCMDNNSYICKRSNGTSTATQSHQGPIIG